jgi:hypothetical protein
MTVEEEVHWLTGKIKKASMRIPNHVETGKHVKQLNTHVEGRDGKSLSFGILQNFDQVFASDDTAVPEKKHVNPHNLTESSTKREREENLRLYPEQQ